MKILAFCVLTTGSSAEGVPASTGAPVAREMARDEIITLTVPAFLSLAAMRSRRSSIALGSKQGVPKSRTPLLLLPAIPN
jgi:hypothetical protein